MVWMGLVGLVLCGFLVVWSCCVVSGRIARTEEEYEWMKREMSKEASRIDNS